MSGIKHQSIINALGIRLSDAAFAVWRRWCDKDDRSAFYVETRIFLMRAGLAHPTLGRKVPVRKWYSPMSLIGSTLNQRDHAERGMAEFKLFTGFGIEPHHCVIDYGCGSLRMAQKFIPFLRNGTYWGFDISQQFIDDGLLNLKTLGIKSERGNFRIISPESLAEGKAQHADFVISSKVLMHIGPDDLEQFIQQLTSLIHDDTTLIVEFDESDANMRTSGSSWAYSAGRISEAFTAHLPDHEISINRIKKKHRFFNSQIYRSYLSASPAKPAAMLTGNDAATRYLETELVP